MKKLIFYIVVIAGLSALMFNGVSNQPETLTEKFNKKEMEAAIQQAQMTFDDFLKRFKKPQPKDENFSVKVKIEDSNGEEHFWLNDLQLGSEPYSGKIGNDAGIVKNIKLGQKHNFYRKDISDWMFMSNGTMEGNYTLGVIIKSMPKEEADALKKKIGW